MYSTRSDSITTEIELQNVLGALTGVVRCGQGWKARCPVHEDDKASLSINQRDSKLLVKCHANCDQKSVWKAIEKNLRPIQLPSKPLRVKEPEPLDYDLLHRVYSKFVEHSELLEEDCLSLVARGLSKEWIAKSKFASMQSVKTSRSTLLLHKEFGDSLYRVPGFEKINGKPRLAFSEGILCPVVSSDCRIAGFQIRTNSEPKYLWFSSKSAKTKSVCHLPTQSRDRGRVRITEGVLKAEVASFLDSNSQTWGVPGVGAMSSAIPPILGLPVSTPIYIAFDSDWRIKPQVRRAIHELQRLIHETGRKAYIEIWDEKYKGIDDALLAQAEITVVDRLPTDSTVRAISELQEIEVEWLWKGWIPRGMLCVLEGDPSLGKSTLTADIAMRITRGVPFPGDSERPAKGGVLFLASEDDPARIIRPRLVASGADLERVFVLEKHWSFPENLEDLEATILENQIRLVVLDPFFAYLSPEIDSYKDQAVRAVLGPLAKLAERTHCSLMLIRHLTKSTASNLYRGAGSIAVVGQARVCMLLASDSDDEDDRILSQVKNNLAPKQVGWRFGFAESEDWKSTTIEWKGRSRKHD